VAIAYVRAKPIWLTDTGGVTQQFAYAGRTIMMDPRPEIAAFDYSALREDLAQVEVLLPPDTPAVYLDPAALAYALDAKEIKKVRTPLSQRKRLPQIVMSAVIALPPAFEVSRDEALIIARRIAQSPCGSHRVPIHLAIHSASVNRHAHAHIALRPMAPDGSLGLKISDFLARFRSHYADIDPVEGTCWPDISWEIQETFFAERAIDLVVSPSAPAPGYHFDGDIPDQVTAQWIKDQRLARRHVNIRMIKTSPTQSIEKIARGRSAIRVAELHRLCARFIDNEEDRHAQVDRMLADQNIVLMSDGIEAGMPRFVTTRRVARIIDKACELIDHGEHAMIAVSGADHDAVVAQLVELYVINDQEREPPLILGRVFSDGATAAKALTKCNPVLGTLDMILGEPSERARGRRRHVDLKVERDIIIPHAEVIEDQQLARLILAAHRSGSNLLFGHDQSCERGIVRSFLAALIADRQKAQPIVGRDHEESQTIERLLRAGLLRHAIEAMADLKLLHFGARPDFSLNAAPSFAVVDESRIKEVGNAIRTARARAGLLGEIETLTGPRGEIQLSPGEWVATTGTRGLLTTMDAHQLAQIVNIDPAANRIEVQRHGKVIRLNIEDDPAIRPAEAIAIRAAWDAPPDANLVIELADPRHVWAGLLLASDRIKHARIHIDPSIAETPNELIDAARRSLPAAWMSHRAMQQNNSPTSVENMLDDFDPFPERQATEPEQALPPPVGFNEAVRHRIMKDRQTQLAYRLLHEHVSPQNTNRHQNAQRAFELCSSELTQQIVLALAEQDEAPDFDGVDLPLELVELEPRHWDPWELYKFELDLKLMTIRTAGWGFLPIIIPIEARYAQDIDPATGL
jgi:hypothetical protein